MLNRVTIMGRMTKDAELRRTQSGISVTSFSVACDRNSKDEKGVDFFDIVAWRGTAEFVCKYLGKGRMVAIDGRLTTREWTDRDGKKHTAVEIVADSVFFGDSKRESAPEVERPTLQEVDEEDGELPF